MSAPLASGLRTVSPLFVEIGVHYACIAAEFPRADAPACREAIDCFVAAGLLEWSAKENRHVATDGLKLWVDYLCAVPFPEETWTMAYPLPEGRADSEWSPRNPHCWLFGVTECRRTDCAERHQCVRRAESEQAS